MAKHKCEMSFLSRSDGAALYSIGNTVALASVHGPGDTKKTNRQYDRAFLEVCYSPPGGQSMVSERAVESVIARTVEEVVLLHLHPRTAITLTIQAMQSDGLALSCGVNASCLALLDAAVHLSNTFAAVTCCVTPDDVVIVEPTLAETKESNAVLTFVFEGAELNVLSAHQEGVLSDALFSTCLSKCQEAAKDVFAFYRRVVEDKYKEDLYGGV